MKKIISSFYDLTLDQLYDLLKLRQEVFVIEQNCIYPDFDGYDRHAVHFLIYDNNTLAAYSRIFAPDTKYKNESSIGRIIVSKEYRGNILGKNLIKDSIAYSLERFPNALIRIEAQAQLTAYYGRLGFKSDSDVYVVDGINHLQMIYDTKS